MKKHFYTILSLILIPLLLASCGTTKRRVKRNSKAEHDSDPITSITNDETSQTAEDQEHQQTIDDEQSHVVPTEDERETVENGTTISSAGNYTLKGDYDYVEITASSGSEVYIYLDGATINSSTGIALSNKNKGIIVHLVVINGSTNSIINDFADKNALHIKGNLFISGNGTLNIESKQKSAIKVSETLTISGVTINATSSKHAITAETLVASGCTLNCSATDGDGIQTEYEAETYSSAKGYVYLKNVNLTINGKGDGIQASTYIDIYGGTINVSLTGTFVPYSEKATYELTDDDYKWNSQYKRIASDSHTSYSSRYALTSSVKALKAGPIENSAGEDLVSGDYAITLRGLSTITLNSTDDAVHSNYGKVSIESVNLTITTSDDAIHADYNTIINNASIVVNDSYEGIEGQNITIDGENTNIVVNSQDDGINAASDYGTSYVCTINNGYVRCKAGGDGLDANTTLNINGGTVIVEGPGSGNGSLDADRININGGIVFACSNNGMLENMTATQPTFIYSGSSQAANSLISVTDAADDDNALFTYTLKLSCTQIIFSAPGMSVGKTYTIFNGETEVADINMTSSLTKVGSSGGGPGGGGWH